MGSNLLAINVTPNNSFLMRCEKQAFDVVEIKITVILSIKVEQKFKVVSFPRKSNYVHC